MVAATRGAQGFGDDDMTHDVNRLMAAELYWVSPDMTAFALNASADLPEWAPLLATPARFGLLVWDGGMPSLPWTGSPERGFTVSPLGARRPPQVDVHGVVWGPDERGLVLYPLARSAELGDLLTPRWAACDLFTFGAVVVPWDEPLQVEHLRGDAAGFVAAVGATWLLMQQPTVVDGRPLHERDGTHAAGATPRPDRQVRIIDLRRAASAVRDGDDSSSGRSYKHRCVVSGHWRQQAVGPGRAQRRPTYVAPYVKGPAGAPMLDTERVNVWRR